MVQDFGENRKAASAAEIKSAHFGKHPNNCSSSSVFLQVWRQRGKREPHLSQR